MGVVSDVYHGQSSIDPLVPYLKMCISCSDLSKKPMFKQYTRAKRALQVICYIMMAHANVCRMSTEDKRCHQ